MTAYPRKIQRVFGGDLSVPGNVAVIGSLQAGAVAYSGDIKTLQSLSGFGQGMNGVVVGNRVISMEEMTALLYVLTGQMAYALQSGVPEWDADTTYYAGNIVRGVGTGLTGVLYTSLTDGNLNNALTDTNNWSSSVGALNAIAAMSTGQSVAISGAGVKISLNAKTFDPNNLYSNANARYTAAAGGAYTIKASLQVDNVSGTAAAMEISCRAVVNGATVAWSQGTSVASPPGSRWYPSLCGDIVISAGDTVEIQLSLTDGVNSGTVNVSNSIWSITKI